MTPTRCPEERGRAVAVARGACVVASFHQRDERREVALSRGAQTLVELEATACFALLQQRLPLREREHRQGTGRRGRPRHQLRAAFARGLECGLVRRPVLHEHVVAHPSLACAEETAAPAVQLAVGELPLEMGSRRQQNAASAARACVGDDRGRRESQIDRACELACVGEAPRALEPEVADGCVLNRAVRGAEARSCAQAAKGRPGRPGLEVGSRQSGGGANGVLA
mmetsp:Transcript_45105/g.111849  ORF Transcript_45105/g.111849 Transcript_45105/m.111849 type:complete len:226 (-) Transcript_45105:167-844(-)